MSGTFLSDLISRIIQEQCARNPDRPALIGVSGAQGSGKTTVCETLVKANAPRFVQFSIDDVYLDHAQRAELAARTHSLFVTRGPPGTHDIALARDTIDRLSSAGPETETPLPRFDKIKDVMKPLADWPIARGRPEAILIDAWCLGALPIPASPALNAVEQEDAHGVWRETQNEYLRTTYSDWFANFDAIIYLRAPSWDIVRHWRGQQEVTLRGRALTAGEETWIDRFILHYERITRSMMDGQVMASRTVQIDEQRNVVSIKEST